MKTLSDEEARKILRKSGVLEEVKVAASRWDRFSIPADSGRKVAFARRIRELLPSSGESIIAVLDRDIWPSSGNEHVFCHYVSGSLELDAIPSPLLCLCQNTAEDLDWLEGILALSLLFIYQGYIVSDHGRFILFISHDEYLSVLGGGTVYDEVVALLKGTTE